MTTDVFKGITVVGTSNESFSHAIGVAIERAQMTIRELRWFEVKEQRGALVSGLPCRRGGSGLLCGRDRCHERDEEERAHRAVSRV